MSTTHDQLYAVGTIVKAIGIAGEVVVQPMTDFPAKFRTLRVLWIGSDNVSVAEAAVETTDEPAEEAAPAEEAEE